MEHSPTPPSSPRQSFSEAVKDSMRGAAGKELDGGGGGACRRSMCGEGSWTVGEAPKLAMHSRMCSSRASWVCPLPSVGKIRPQTGQRSSSETAGRLGATAARVSPSAGGCLTAVMVTDRRTDCPCPGKPEGRSFDPSVRRSWRGEAVSC